MIANRLHRSRQVLRQKTCNVRLKDSPTRGPAIKPAMNVPVPTVESHEMSKIADSAAEGVNLVGDKAFAEEPPVVPVEETVALEASAPEEFDFDAAVGPGIRKAPAAVAALLDEDEAAGGYAGAAIGRETGGLGRAGYCGFRRDFVRGVHAARDFCAFAAAIFGR